MLMPKANKRLTPCLGSNPACEGGQSGAIDGVNASPPPDFWLLHYKGRSELEDGASWEKLRLPSPLDLLAANSSPTDLPEHSLYSDSLCRQLVGTHSTDEKSKRMKKMNWE